MKYIVVIGIVFLMIPLANAITYSQKPILTIVHNEDIFTENVETGDNNVYDVYCNYKYSNICDVYRTDNIHTVLIGE